jgi:hypothetical protein
VHPSREHLLRPRSLLNSLAALDGPIERMSFTPGQAVEVSASGQQPPRHLPQSGAYAVASSPSRLQRSGEIVLVVKHSASYAPTRWLTEEVEVGGVVVR